MNIKFLSENARMPKRATNQSAGYDLYVPADTIIKPGRNIVPLNIAIAIPTGMEGHIRPRSGFSAKGMEGFPYIKQGESAQCHEKRRYDADVLQGTIDSDYRGCVGVLVSSHEKEPFVVEKGTRIAQLVISAYFSEDWAVCNELNDTQRSNGGFGHTGTK